MDDIRRPLATYLFMAEIKLTKMTRNGMFADVHPDEVQHMRDHGWVDAGASDEFHDDGTPKVLYTEEDAAEQAEKPTKRKKAN